IPLSFVLFGDGPAGEGIGVAAGSPLMGVGIYSSLLAGAGPGHELVGQTAWTIFWTPAYGGGRPPPGGEGRARRGRAPPGGRPRAEENGGRSARDRALNVADPFPGGVTPLP